MVVLFTPRFSSFLREESNDFNQVKAMRTTLRNRQYEKGKPVCSSEEAST